MKAARRALWVAGWPIRAALLLLIRAYRATIGPWLGGRCRFHPSCSMYAELAISELGWVRGVPLAAWRILRCSPLSPGGVDFPPRVRPAASEPGSAAAYDGVIQPRAGAGRSA